MGKIPVVLHGGAREGLVDLIPATPTGGTIVYEQTGFGRLPAEEYVLTDQRETLPAGGKATVARFLCVHGD
jgi:hypothetical protein